MTTDDVRRLGDATQVSVVEPDEADGGGRIDRQLSRVDDALAGVRAAVRDTFADQPRTGPVSSIDLLALRDRMKAHGQLQVATSDGITETKLYRGPVPRSADAIPVVSISVALYCRMLHAVECALDWGRDREDATWFRPLTDVYDALPEAPDDQPRRVVNNLGEALVKFGDSMIAEATANKLRRERATPVDVPMGPPMPFSMSPGDRQEWEESLGCSAQAGHAGDAAASGPVPLADRKPEASAASSSDNACAACGRPT